VAAGEPLALINSAGLLEIAVTNGSAAQTFQANVGAAVHCRPLPQSHKA
jgi:S-adenosylmethionine hydrolase